MGSSGADETYESVGTDIDARTNSVTRIREWVLVDGDRLVVALGLSVLVFVLFLSLGRLGIVSFVNADSMTRLAGGMIAGTFSLVTLVVSINQLILSREFVAAGEARDRLGSVTSFRADVADAAAVPAAPAAPTNVLEVLAETIHGRAATLADAVSDHDDEVREQITRYTDAVTAAADRLDEAVERTSFGTFQAVLASIRYDTSRQLYVARHLENRHADSLSAEADDSFDDLLDALELLDVAREHFKTTYLQRELTRFSQLTIYCGVPAVLSAMLVGLLYADVGGPAIDVALLPVVVSGLVTVVVSPLALLASYILRTATVTRRTASIGPMLPQKDPDAGPFDVTDGSENPVESGGEREGGK